MKKQKFEEVEIELPDAEYKALLKEAKKRKMTFNELVNFAVNEYMQIYNKK